MLNLLMENHLLLAIGLYLCLMFALIVYKPSVCYQDDETLKGFGREPSETLFTIVVLSVLLAVLSYATTIGFAVINKFLGKKVK
jgi:hypothetical protein